MLNVREVIPRNGSLRLSMKKTLGNATLSLSRYLSINTKKEQFTGLNFWRPQTTEETTALSLSGGGSKGSFQVGTLHFFDKSGLWSKFRVTRIASSSVGSVNALKLAEGRKQSISEMLKIWMGLKLPSHMYSKTKELKNIEAQLDSGFGTIAINEFLSGVRMALPFQIDGISDDIGDLVRDGSIFNLKPTRNSLSRNVDFNKVKNSKIELRFVASEQRTQRPVAFTKNGMLIRPRNETTPIPRTNWSIYESVKLKSIAGKTKFKDRMLSAVEASAAIPGVFPLVEAIETKNRKDWKGFYVDGGVNDILPRRYAGTLNGIASSLTHEPIHFLSIFAGTVDVENEAAPIEEQEKYRRKYFLNSKGEEDTINKKTLNFPIIRPSWRWEKDHIAPNLIENITRGLFSSLSEVSRGDTSEGQQGSGKEIVIQPYQGVHGTVEVHPGKLRINAAYGYMSAFDQLLIAGGELTEVEKHHLLKTSYDITRRRVLAIKRQELAIESFVNSFLADSLTGKGAQKFVDAFLAYIDENPISNLSTPEKIIKLKKDIAQHRGPILLAEGRSNIENGLNQIRLLSTEMVFGSETIKRLREDKNTIAQLVIFRVQHFGLGSVPINLDVSKDTERKHNNSVASWWTDFELSNRNNWFLDRELKKRQNIGTSGVFLTSTTTFSEKDASFKLKPRNLPIDIVRSLS